MRQLLIKVNFTGTVTVVNGRFGLFKGKRFDQYSDWPRAGGDHFGEGDTATLQDLLDTALENQTGAYEVEIRLKRVNK